MTVAGVILGIRDDRAEAPARDDKWLRSLGSIQLKAARQAMPQSMLYLRTAVFALGTEKGARLIESLEGAEALFIARDRSVSVRCGEIK